MKKRNTYQRRPPRDRSPMTPAERRAEVVSVLAEALLGMALREAQAANDPPEPAPPPPRGEPHP